MMLYDSDGRLDVVKHTLDDLPLVWPRREMISPHGGAPQGGRARVGNVLRRQNACMPLE
jgi:hypothetical protein